MQPEYSTYGTELQLKFFYKALTPMGFGKFLTGWYRNWSILLKNLNSG